MSEALVTLTIDGKEVTVPEGTLVVDAAKQVGIEIPVFCYHPKIEPAGMCRMCLVEVGEPKRDRATGEIVRDENGEPVIEFRPKLETSCTLPVSEGMVVRVMSEKAVEARREIVEFLLTSHPLDCPICDKGGECSLQNLAMEHGPGKSRFEYEDKKHLPKHVPLGDLIVLDEERCILCGRCVRFQEKVVDQPVLGMEARGRDQHVVTYSDPGFDSYFSGNTTDICPVGALTTVDFRFGARPWELNASASLCTHCPVGCNLMLNTRREASSDGRKVIKRVMPRQNEAVNEIWICDKGRFAHHFATSPERLQAPLVRRDGALVESTWPDAIAKAAKGLKEAADRLVGVASGRLSNEDLAAFRRLVEKLGGQAYLYEEMAGGDLIQQVGLARGSNLGSLGQGDAIVVIASELYEEAPIWWLRVIQAVKRGATLVLLNARSTRLDGYAKYTLRYETGAAAATALGLLQGVSGEKSLQAYAKDEFAPAAKALKDARHLVVFYGGEGLDREGSAAVARACARILQETGHAGKANSGLIAVWPRANTQGAWDMGLRPAEDSLPSALEGAKALYLAGVDPAADSPELAKAVESAGFVVVQELFHTATTELADVVLPASSFVERDGTFTTGERRVQRFFPAIPPMGGAKPDWSITADLAAAAGVEMQARTTADIFLSLVQEAPGYAGLTYKDLAQTAPQWPPVGEADLYFGGTAFKNRQGLGVSVGCAAEAGQLAPIEWIEPGAAIGGEWLLVPITVLYDHGRTVSASDVLRPRLAAKAVRMNPEDLGQLGLDPGSEVELRWNGHTHRLPALAEEGVPRGAVLLPRSLGFPAHTPAAVDVRKVS